MYNRDLPIMFNLMQSVVWCLLLLACGVSAVSESDCAKYRHTRKVWVTNNQQFAKAVHTARPGDLIFMKDGKYSNVVRGGKYRRIDFTRKNGNKWRPITLCGSSKAVVDAKGGIGLRIHKSKYVNIVGITVKNALKGIRLEGAERCTLDSVTVTQTHSEAIHIQYGSHYNTVKNCRITNTGRRNKGVGEGIYLGSSSKNTRNDKCIGNQILYNTIGPGVTAEPIDVKENTRDGVVKGNILDGRDLCSCKHAVSLINVKGNGYLIEGNVGKNAKQDFFKTSQTIRGEGRNNTFKKNKCVGRIRKGFSCTRRPGGGNRGNKFY